MSFKEYLKVLYALLVASVLAAFCVPIIMLLLMELFDIVKGDFSSFEDLGNSVGGVIVFILMFSASGLAIAILPVLLIAYPFCLNAYKKRKNSYLRAFYVAGLIGLLSFVVLGIFAVLFLVGALLAAFFYCKMMERYMPDDKAKPTLYDSVIEELRHDPNKMRKYIEALKKQMLAAAADLEFEEAARLRDEITALEQKELGV